MEQTIIRSSSPFEVLALAEHTLGFRPRESVVLVSLRPPRWRTGLVARADLADLELPGMLEGLVEHLRADGAGRCFVAVSTDEGRVPRVPRPRTSDPQLLRAQALSRLQRLPRARLARRVQSVLLGAGIEPEPWLVHRGRLHSYTCARPCCPPRGLPTEQLASTQVAAEMVLAGRVLAPDRPEWERQLRASVRPVPGPDAAAVACGVRGSGGCGPAAPEVALALWCSLTTARDAAPGAGRPAAAQPLDGSAGADGIGPAAAVTLLEALGAVPLRDVLLGAVAPGALPPCSGEACGAGCVWPPGWGATTCAVSTAERSLAGGPRPDPGSAVRVLARLARLAPPGLRAVPLGCAAYLLWWSGAMAPAGVHAELALADDPGHSLSQLVRCGVLAGLPSPLVGDGRGGSSGW